MVLLGYSNGRGRGRFQRGSPFVTSSLSHGPGRGRLSSDFGGNSFRGRGRGNMRWTNPSESKVPVNTHASSHSAAGSRSLGIQQTSAGTRGNKVWLNTKASPSAEGISGTAASASEKTSSSGTNHANTIGASRRNPISVLSSSKPCAPSRPGALGTTSKARNRVWTNSSRDSGASGSRSSQDAPQATSVVVADKTAGPQLTSVRCSAPIKREVTLDQALLKTPSRLLGVSQSFESVERIKSRPASAKFNDVGARAQVHNAVGTHTASALHHSHAATKATPLQPKLPSHSFSSGRSRPSSFSTTGVVSVPSKRGNLVWTKPGGDERGTKRKLNTPSVRADCISVAPFPLVGSGGRDNGRYSAPSLEPVMATGVPMNAGTATCRSVSDRSGSSISLQSSAMVSFKAAAVGLKAQTITMKAEAATAGGHEGVASTSPMKMVVGSRGSKGIPALKASTSSVRETTTTVVVAPKTVSRYSACSVKAPASAFKSRANTARGIATEARSAVPERPEMSIPQPGTTTSAPVAPKKTISRYSRSSVKPASRAARSSVRPISKFSRCSTSTSPKTTASHSKAVARFSRTVNRQSKSMSSRGGLSGAVSRVGLTRKASTGGHVARYSGAWTGRGEQASGSSRVRALVAIDKGVGWASVPRGRGGGAVGVAGYGAMVPGRGGRPGWRGRGPWDYQAGRGGKFRAPGRGGCIPLRVAPAFTRGHRYSSRVLRVSPLVCPSPHVLTRWNPWVRDPPGWKGRGPGAKSLSSMKLRRPAFKNRTLIRVRSLPPPRSVPETAVVPAPRVSAVSRSSTNVVAKTKTSSKFVRSGKHGMAIRRVSSSPIASPTATKSASSKPVSSKKLRAASSTGVGSASVTPRKNITSTPVREKGGAAGRAKSTGAAKSKSGIARATTPTSQKGSSATAATTPASSRREALRKKILERSKTSRKAAVLVAGARATRARVVGRNLTLYRGKGGGAGSVGGDQGSAKAKKVKTEPCLFYCKFGKCSKSDEECPYIHDKTKVAVCLGFLKGKCTKENCPLTHAVQAEKMPVCIYFEKGMCFTPNCPYRHVKVSKKAAICPNFAKGYCPDGTACRLRHEIVAKKRSGDGSDGGKQGDGRAKKLKNKTTSKTGGESWSGPKVGCITSSSLPPGQQGKSDLASRPAAAAAAPETQGGHSSSRAISIPPGNPHEAGSVEQVPSVVSPERSVAGASGDPGEGNDMAGLMPRLPWKRHRV